MKERIHQFMEAVVAASKPPEKEAVVVNATADKKPAKDTTDLEFLLSEEETAPPVEPGTILDPEAGGANAIAAKAIGGRPKNAPAKGSKQALKDMKEMVEGAFQVVAKGEKVDAYLGPPLAAPSANSITGAYDQYWARKDQISKSATDAAKKAVAKAEAQAKTILEDKGAKSPEYEDALERVADKKAILDNVGRSKSDALRAVDDVRKAYKTIAAAKGATSADTIAAKKRMVSMEKALAAYKGMGAQAEPQMLKEAKRAIELIETKRLYSELRHRERFMWDADILTKTRSFVTNLMNNELNATIDAFKDKMKERMDLNSTQIDAKVKIHLVEQGYSPISEKGRLVAEQWKWTYRYSNVSDSKIFQSPAIGPDGKQIDVVSILTKRLPIEIEPKYIDAYRPMQAWEFDQAARKRCAAEAKRVMNNRMLATKAARDAAAQSAQQAKAKMKAMMGAADKTEMEINKRVQKMWAYISEKGPAKLKKDFKFAMDNKAKADREAKQKQPGALGMAGNADKELQTQIDLAATSFSDAKGADLMTSLKLEIAMLKNPPAKPGEFGVGL